VKYYLISTGEPAATPWRIVSPDGLVELVKSTAVPLNFSQKLTADQARKLATDWSLSQE